MLLVVVVGCYCCSVFFRGSGITAHKEDPSIRRDKSNAVVVNDFNKKYSVDRQLRRWTMTPRSHMDFVMNNVARINKESNPGDIVEYGRAA